MSTITCKDPVNFAFMDFQALETLEYFWISRSDNPYQKVPLFIPKFMQGDHIDLKTKEYNAINRKTNEPAYVVNNTCIHPYVATIELTPQVVDSEVLA